MTMGPFLLLTALVNGTEGKEAPEDGVAFACVPCPGSRVLCVLYQKRPDRSVLVLVLVLLIKIHPENREIVKICDKGKHTAE